MKNLNKVYRHGDNDIKEIDHIPEEATEIKTNVIAEGEVTGHKHQLVKGAAKLYLLNVANYIQKHNEATFRENFKVPENVSIAEIGKTLLLFQVLQACQLIHQEHKTINLPRGTYVKLNEREYDPFAKKIREVQD